MTVRIPALTDVLCPKCKACNHGAAVSVWEVVDATGRYFDCDVCSRIWLGDNTDRRDSKGKPL